MPILGRYEALCLINVVRTHLERYSGFYEQGVTVHKVGHALDEHALVKPQGWCIMGKDSSTSVAADRDYLFEAINIDGYLALLQDVLERYP